MSESAAIDGILDSIPEAKESLLDFMSVLSVTSDEAENRKFIKSTLYKAQDLYGYIPGSVQHFIAAGLKIHVTEVSGAVSFFSDFISERQEKYKIAVCVGQACCKHNSVNLYTDVCEKIGLSEGQITTEDMMFSLKTRSCLGRCGTGPAVLINKEIRDQVSSDELLLFVDEVIEKEKI